MPYGLTIDMEFMPFSDVVDLQAAWRLVRESSAANAGILIDTLHFGRTPSTLDQLDAIPPRFFHYAQLCDAAAIHSGSEPPGDLRALIAEREHGALLARIERALTHPADWEARAGAAPDDVRQWWTHVVTLHRRTRTLNKELKEAERALGDDPSEKNFAWLRDVQSRLSAIAGTEASIEGFGVLSGRPLRSL